MELLYHGYWCFVDIKYALEMHFPEDCQKLTFKYIPSALSLKKILPLNAVMLLRGKALVFICGHV
jgi:hypothetical protein